MTGIHNKYKKAVVNIVLIILVIFICLSIVPKIILLCMPFVLGCFFALLLNPFVCFLEKKIKAKRKVSALFVMLLFIVLICLLLFLIGYRLRVKVYQLWEILPDMWHQLEGEFVMIWGQWLPVLDQFPVDVVKTAEEVGETIGNRIPILISDYSISAAGSLKKMADNIPKMMIAVIMCILSTYFFSSEVESQASKA